MVREPWGGLMTVGTARDKPVHTVLSGPAGGVVASAHVARLSGFDDIITMDMGGTSTDISLILGGKPQVTREASLERTPIRIPVIDIHAIGAGGGSIAWIDEGGALRVGPRSAEAVPGPACYGRGGPPPPGILCALGMLVADLRHDLVQTKLAPHGALSAADAERVFAPLLAEAGRLLDADAMPAERRRIETRVDMRYIGQSYELPIPV